VKARTQCLLLALLWAAQPIHSLVAHEDTIIRLEGTQLVGLPQQYQPAELDVRAYRIRIRGQTKEFSPWLKSIFDQPHELRISASWYNYSILPPYLLLSITPAGKNYTYQILVDMDAVRLIEVKKARQSGGGTTFFPIELSDFDISKAAPKTP
jgi:hypothetical protein